MSFEEDPRDNDPHAECAHEIHRLEKRVAELEAHLEQAKAIIDRKDRELSDLHNGFADSIESREN